jgi:hypothetical protein
MQRPKLKDNQGKRPFDLYPLGQIPSIIIVEIAKWITYFCAIGKDDIDGEEWGDIFANSVGGKHLGKPIGLADVIYDKMAWSVKSVKSNNPYNQKKIRVISGRCSPDYSFGMSNPHEHCQKTGDAVLSIWNERINIAKNQFEPLRTTILIRNFTTLEFTLFEHETVRYIASDYRWEFNKNGNLEGFDIATDTHMFTWQPHGSQFTIIFDRPPSAIRFKINQPPNINFEDLIQQIGFDPSWVVFV